MVPEHRSLTDTSHISGRVRSGYFLTAIYPMAAPDWQNTAGEGYMTVVNGLTITTVLAWTCFHFLQISPISPAGSILLPSQKTVYIDSPPQISDSLSSFLILSYYNLALFSEKMVTKYYRTSPPESNLPKSVFTFQSKPSGLLK